MKRKLLKVLALTVVFSLSSASNVPLTLAAENTGSGTLKALSESDTEANSMFTAGNNQGDAQKAYAELMQSYNGSSDMAYKEYYGGAYVGDDNVLVVNVTTQSDDVKNEIQEITVAQNVKFKEVVYSYRQLMNLYEIILDKLEDSGLKEKVNCFYVDETNNRVVVEVFDDGTISSFRQEILSDEVVTFHVVKEAITDDVAVEPGVGLPVAGTAEQGGDIASHDVKLLYPQLNEVFSKDGIQYKVIKKTSKNMDVAVCGCSQNRKTVKIPGSVTFQRKTYKVTTIVKAAFKNQSKLRKVVAGKNVNKIEDSAFVKCRWLSSIIIKNKDCKYNEEIVKKSGKCKIKVAGYIAVG